MIFYFLHFLTLPSHVVRAAQLRQQPGEADGALTLQCTLLLRGEPQDREHHTWLRVSGTASYSTHRYNTIHDSEYKVQHHTWLRVSGTAQYTTQSIRYGTIHDSEYQVQHYHIHNSEYQVPRPVLRCGEPQDREHHTRLRVSGAVAYAGIFKGGGGVKN